MAGALQTAADRLIPVNTESPQLTSSVPGAGAPPGVHWAQEVTTHGGSRGLYIVLYHTENQQLPLTSDSVG